MAKVLLFPGQGSQKVGMLAAFVNGFKAGMEVVEEIEDAVSFKISKLIDDGSLEDLTKTENAQIAIFTTSMACIKILEKEYGYDFRDCKYFAGHSLGEYSALCSAGVFSVMTGAKLVRFRGELMASMQSLEECGQFSMTAIINMQLEKLEEILTSYQSGRNICVIANDNSLSQQVISGHNDVVLEVSQQALKNGASKAIKLNTSGPFHSPLMAKAAIEFDKFLTNYEFNDFKVPVIMNVIGQPVTEKNIVHNILVEQITSRVRWRESMNFVANDPEIEEIVEIAPGRVLSSMFKREFTNFSKISNIETVAQIEEFVKSI